MDLSSDIIYLKGVGPQRAMLLQRELQIATCADLLEIYHLITRANLPLRYRGHHNMAKIPGIRIRVNEDMDIELFYQALRQLTAIAFAEIPKSCLKSTEITIDDQWHDPEAEAEEE